MSTVAAATVATLLIASPSMTDADHIAADGGFLLGNAQRCGVADERIVQTGRLVRGLISAAAEDGKAEQAATSRFAAFFLVSALSGSPNEGPLASCRIVAIELKRLAHHQIRLAGAGE